MSLLKKIKKGMKKDWMLNTKESTIKKLDRK